MIALSSTLGIKNPMAINIEVIINPGLVLAFTKFYIYRLIFEFCVSSLKLRFTIGSIRTCICFFSLPLFYNLFPNF